MISPINLFNFLKERDIDFFTGVPDSLLKNFCAYITDNTNSKNHIIAANEGNAIGIASGYHLATNKIPFVYLQNSGIGNAINPLLSLTDSDVYNIPALLMIGWRGEPGVKDEPQHIKQGIVTPDLLDAIKIPYLVLDENEIEAEKQIDFALNKIKETNTVFALLVRKNTFESYSIKINIETAYSLYREEAIRIILDNLDGDEFIVSTTGKTSRELFECREEKKESHDFDFLTVGSMGHTSQISLGIALNKPDKKIICIDGDGAVLMHMGGLSIIGNQAPNNLLHIVINNGSHESVGGQPTVALGIDLPLIAKANNYKFATKVSNKAELIDALKKVKKEQSLSLIEIMVKVGSRDDLGRPTIKPVMNKENFMKNLASK